MDDIVKLSVNTRTCKRTDEPATINILASLWSFLASRGLLFAHSGDDGDHQSFIERKFCLDLFAYITVFGRSPHIILSIAVPIHQIQEAIIDGYKFVFSTLDVGHIHVVGGGTDVFEFLSSEDVDRNQVHLCMPVLASFGGGHINDLARPALDHNMTILPEGTALHREGERGTRGGLLKRLVMLIVTHDGDSGR